MAVLRQPIRPALLFVPVAMLILAIFTTGATLLLATFTVFFRDVRHLTEVLLQMLLYLSPCSTTSRSSPSGRLVVPGLQLALR